MAGADLLVFPCGECGAKPGEACRSVFLRGGRYVKTHYDPRNDIYSRDVRPATRTEIKQIHSPYLTYFVEAVGCDLIKIGKTTDLAARMLALRAGSPVELILLATIDGDLESSFHNKFAASRRHSEWFQLSPELREFLDAQPPPKQPIYRSMK